MTRKMFTGMMTMSITRFASIGSSVRPARLIRGLAGATGGWKQSRRGTFLILVVGVLAMLSVLAVLYVTIGNADRQNAAALVKKDRQAQVIEEFRRYVLSIIGDDVTDVLVTDIDGDGVIDDNERVREAWDYPDTDPRMRSDVVFTATPEYLPEYFNPVGRGSDPWLSFGRPSNANTDPNVDPIDPPYLGKVDWLHISNVVPDGAFVNLFNLRNSFAATPVDMRRDLSVVDGEGNDASGGARDPDVPADWTRLQFKSFRPMDSSLTALDWSSRDNVRYQWVDTDGDGMADSRVFEMVDARTGDPDTFRSLLPADQRYRYFFAVKIEDLSGRLNVNTATDFLNPPTHNSPAGLKPSDIDLRRFLLNEDQWDINGGTNGSGYDGLFQPQGAPSDRADDYSEKDGAAAAGSGRFGYHALRIALRTGVVPPYRDLEFDLYLYARDVLGLTDGDWRFAPADNEPAFSDVDFPDGAASARHAYYREAAGSSMGIGWEGSGNTYLVNSPFTLEDLTELLTYRGVNDPKQVSPLEATLGGRFGAAEDSLDPLTLRYSPMRENRGHDLERAKRDTGPDNSSPADGYAASKSLLQSDVDIRQGLTTLSGARPIRSTLTSSPWIASSELRTSAPDLLTNINGLFAGYADALAPYSGVENAWPTRSGGGPLHARHKTLHYGFPGVGAGNAPGGPELALRIAAHLSVNMKDMADGDDTPSIGAVLLDGDFGTIGSGTLWATLPGMRPLGAGALTGPTDGNADGNNVISRADILASRFPGWHSNGALDLGAERLAQSSAGEAVQSPALNVYGIEAQPFITEVATFTMQTDAPLLTGGLVDQGDVDEFPPPPPGDPRPLVTINGAVTSDTADHIVRIIAFQIHNPFGETISLSTLGNPDDIRAGGFPDLDRDREFFYIEFAGQYFHLAEVREQTDTSSGSEQFNGDIRLVPLTIGAGQTIVCYALNKPMPDVVKRIAQLRGRTTADATDFGFLKAWLGRQLFVPGGRMVQIPLIDTGANLADLPLEPSLLAAQWQPVLAENEADYFSFFPNGVNASEVRLWRAVRDTREESRIDPPATIDGGWGENKPVSQYAPDTNVEFPDGSTANLYVRNERMNDQLVDRMRITNPALLDRQLPSGDTSVTGAFSGSETAPEPGTFNTGLTITLWGSCRRPDDQSVGATPLRSHFPGYCIEPRNPVQVWNFIDNDPHSGSPTLAMFQSGEGKTTLENLLTSQAGVCGTLVERPHEKTGHAMPIPAGAERWYDPPSGESEAPQVQFDDNGFNIGSTTEKRLRIADMLLPLGLGPQLDPQPDFWDPDNGNYEGWTTLGEAMARAAAYDTFPVVERQSFSVEIEDELPGVLDEGCLDVENFAPFYDMNANGTYDFGADVSAAPGAPLGANVLDVFWAMSGKFGGVSRAIPGLVNINTAPVEVLRMLPMLSPKVNMPFDVAPWWGGTGIEGSPHDSTSDIAATIVAYRDKVLVSPRTGGTLDFRNGPQGRAAAFTPLPHTEPLPAFNETPGFRSLAELMLCRASDQFPGSTAYPFWHDIDRLGADEFRSSRAGVETIMHGSSASPVPDVLGDEYDEKLGIINGALAGITIRSDVYAVWFVVQGYQESDVKGLTANDPLIPSLQRRFLMVVDRSNVTQSGQLPRVILFKEVPM